MDHKPVMGPDPRLIGLFHNCGHNSAGMMLGGGCGEQLAEWIIHGRPELFMAKYDVRRFSPKQIYDKQYALERCHEAYSDTYRMVFQHSQPLSGRNLTKDSLHDELIANGAIMEEMAGWERPAFFDKEKAPMNIPPYDWCGAYDHTLNTDKTYKRIVQGDETYGFSKHHDQVMPYARHIQFTCFN